MFRVSMSIGGEVAVDRLINGIEERSRNVGPAWPKVVGVFQDIVRLAFGTEGSSTGAAWAPLAPSTQSDRQRNGFPPAHPILQRTGNLMRGLTEGEGAYVRTSPTALEYLLSESIGYFKFHQSKAPRARLPRRAPVELTADNRSALVFPIRLYVTGRDLNAPRRARVG